MLVERKSLLAVQAARKGKAPNWRFPFTARCFAAILPSFVGARVYLPHSLVLFVRIVIFQWVTAYPNKNFAPLSASAQDVPSPRIAQMRSLSVLAAGRPAPDPVR